MNNKHLTYLYLTIFIAFSTGCDSNGSPSPDSEPEEINIEEAKLNDFPIKEIDYQNIEITQPTINNNQEVEKGKILITLPYTVTSLNLTLESVNIDLGKFDILPSVGSTQLFSETEFVRYKIVSKTNPDRIIHYDVQVIVATNPDDEVLSISGFTLSTKDNSLQTSSAVIHESAIQGVDFFVYSLFSEAVDFADLIPSLQYEGSYLEVRVNSGDFFEYQPNSGRSIDFKYPNIVEFKVSNSIKSISEIYRIIADVNQPIHFEESEITIPDTQMGNIYNGTRITTWTNRGNYPIRSMGADDYVNIVTPAAGLSNIFLVSLSDSGTPVKPGQNGYVNVVTRTAPLVGEYKSTGLFRFNFNQNTMTITSRPEDNYINNIGYQSAQLKFKVNITN